MLLFLVYINEIIKMIELGSINIESYIFLQKIDLLRFVSHKS